MTRITWTGPVCQRCARPYLDTHLDCLPITTAGSIGSITINDPAIVWTSNITVAPPDHSNLPADYPQATRWLNPPAEIVVAAEEHPYDVTVIVEGVDPKATNTIHRQYRSKATSPEEAGREIWNGVSNEVKARMAPVNSED
jgi:hypothetical protein